MKKIQILFFVAIMAFSVSCDKGKTEDTQTKSQMGTTNIDIPQGKSVAIAAYRCFYLAHLQLEAYQRLGVIEGYKSGSVEEPKTVASHQKVIDGEFTDAMRFWAWNTYTYFIQKVYVFDKDADLKADQDYLNIINSMNEALSYSDYILEEYIICKDEWIDAVEASKEASK